MTLYWLKSFLVVVTSQLSHVVLVQGSHSYAGRLVWAQLCPHSGAVGACLGEDGFHAPRWEWREGTIHVCVRGGEGEGNTRENKFFFLAAAGREEGCQSSGESWTESSDNWWTSGSDGAKHQSSWWLSMDVYKRRWCAWRGGWLFLACFHHSTCCFPWGEAGFFLRSELCRTSC